MTNREHTQQVIDRVREYTDSVILFYSAGKDSIALLDLIAPHFKRIVCVYMYFVKDLDHINKFIEFSKLRYPNTEFIQVPHWNLTHILGCGTYCQPQSGMPRMTLKDVANSLRSQFHIDYCFYGMKQSDNMNRRIMLRGKAYELQAIQSATKNVYPLSLWGNNDVMAYIKQHRLPMPIRYSTKQKSQGLTFDEKVYLYLRENYPQDLKKILAAFPFSEQILYKHDNNTGDK